MSCLAIPFYQPGLPFRFDFSFNWDWNSFWRNFFELFWLLLMQCLSFAWSQDGKVGLVPQPIHSSFYPFSLLSFHSVFDNMKTTNYNCTSTWYRCSFSCFFTPVVLLVCQMSGRVWLLCRLVATKHNNQRPSCKTLCPAWVYMFTPSILDYRSE